MKIQYASDLHLEFFQNKRWLKNNPLIPNGDILILAGDTYHLGDNFQSLKILESWSEQFEQVYILPGNHEYYGGYDVATAHDPMELNLKPNIKIVNNLVIEYPEVRLIFCTLWSRILNNIPRILSSMMDFKKIRYEGETLSIANYNRLHDSAFSFLQSALNQASDKKTVVVTHHLPSRFCNVEEFKNSKINEGFCVDLTDFIKEAKVDHWIYGHSHRNKPSFKINSTQMITNQLGYLSLNELDAFDRGKYFEV
ncbi:MAG: metallophosphoesterase [Bacteroidota bacterium]